MKNNFPIHKSLGTVSCGRGKLVPSCHFCEAVNQNRSGEWCGGTCYLDEIDDKCKKKGMFCFLAKNLTFCIIY